jgi:hypothetical protein
MKNSGMSYQGSLSPFDKGEYPKGEGLDERIYSDLSEELDGRD